MQLVQRATPEQFAKHLCRLANYHEIPCHVRQWHNGVRGWHCVRDSNYEAITTEHQAIHGTNPICSTCDSTGSVHRADGEYLGECTACDVRIVALQEQAQNATVPDGLLDLIRFLCKVWVDVDAFVYERCKGSLMHYPVVQGTRNQFDLKKISEQPFNAAKVRAGVDVMLSAWAQP